MLDKLIINYKKIYHGKCNELRAGSANQKFLKKHVSRIDFGLSQGSNNQANEFFR